MAFPLPREIEELTVLDLDIEHLLDYCFLNKGTHNICSRSYFWRRYVSKMTHPQFQILLLELTHRKHYGTLNRLLMNSFGKVIDMITLYYAFLYAIEDDDWDEIKVL